MLLLRDHAQLEDEELTRALRAFFDEDDVRSTRVEYRGACLVGFDHSDYPDLRAGDEAVAAQVRAAVTRWHDAVGRRVTAAGLTAVELEIFCVPFPSVTEFRGAVKEPLGL